jgi:drug/metabolite transporter (DMT)-like permease
LKADLLLLLTAAIWGFAFVAQRVGMDHMGPFTFNGIRFSLGAVSLMPLLFWRQRRLGASQKFRVRAVIWPSLLTGLVLFLGASLQQVGLIGITAGKAGFITGLYVILVPLLGLLWGKRTTPANIIGAVLAVVGLYLLSVKRGWEMAPYDVVVLAGAFVWAGHVHLIDRFSDDVGPVRLSMIQFAVCGLLSGVAALIFEEPNIAALQDGFWALFYGAFLSVGLAYTLQVVAQRTADPSHAAIILSLEGVFAALGGWMILQESLSPRGLVGAGLMLGGMLISQQFGRRKRKHRPVSQG